MKALLVVSGIVGYLVIGWICAVVYSAVWATHPRNANHRGRAENLSAFFIGLFWPAAIPIIGLVVIVPKFGSVTHAVVKRLNPEFKGWW